MTLSAVNSGVVFKEYFTSRGVAGARAAQVVKREHLSIKFLSSGMPILLLGSHSNMRRRMESSSGDKGKIELKKFGFLR